MNSPPETIPIQRYIGIDIHKHYLMIGGQTGIRNGPCDPARFRCLDFETGLKRTFNMETRW